MSTISVAIAAHNEAELLEAALASVRTLATEVIVVDGSSSDDTREVAARFGARVIATDNKLMLNVNKNIAIDAAGCDWVLVLDPDERLSPELAAELLEIAADPQAADGWWLARRNHLFGRWIKSMGMYPDRQLRFFRRGSARFACRHIHEMVTLTGTAANARADMIHEPPQELWHYVQKRNLYSEHRAQFLAESSVPFRRWRLALRPVLAFLRIYVLRGGWREGVAGYVIAVSGAYGTFLQDAKLWQKSTGRAGGRDPLPFDTRTPEQVS